MEAAEIAQAAQAAEAAEAAHAVEAAEIAQAAQAAEAAEAAEGGPRLAVAAQDRAHAAEEARQQRAVALDLALHAGVREHEQHAVERPQRPQPRFVLQRRPCAAPRQVPASALQGRLQGRRPCPARDTAAGAGAGTVNPKP